MQRRPDQFLGRRVETGQRERHWLLLGRSELNQRLEVQCLREPGRREPLLLLSAGQFELQTLRLRLHPQGVPFESNTNAHGLIQLPFVILRYGQSLVHDIDEGTRAHQLEILLCGCEA